MNNDLENFLASHPYALATRDTYRRCLSPLVDLPDLEHLSASGLLGFVQARPVGNSQQYVTVCAARRFLAWRYGPLHPALSARIKRYRPRRQRTLTAKLALDLLASFDPRMPKGARDLALAAVALDTGLRCSELCRLKLSDVDLAARSLQVIVKGGQWGIGIFSPETAQYIREWISIREAAAGVGELFVSVTTGKGLTRNGLKCIVRYWGNSIGVKLSPHDLRRSFATLTTIFGAPSRVVQSAGRWSDISMVERYTQALDPNTISPYLPVHRLNP